MPMSEAAMDGVAVNGRRWKYEISLGGFPARIGEMDERTPAEEIETARDAIVKRARKFLERPTLPENMRDAIERDVEDLEMVDPDLDEIRPALGELYDNFDYWRVVVLR